MRKSWGSLGSYICCLASCTCMLVSFTRASAVFKFIACHWMLRLKPNKSPTELVLDLSISRKSFLVYNSLCFCMGYTVSNDANIKVDSKRKRNNDDKQIQWKMKKKLAEIVALYVMLKNIVGRYINNFKGKGIPQWTCMWYKWWVCMSSWLMEVEGMKRTRVTKNRCLLPKFNNIFWKATQIVNYLE